MESSDGEFDEKDLEALAAMASDDETEHEVDDDTPAPEFRNGSPTGSLMSDIEAIDTGKKPEPIEFDEDNEHSLKTVAADAIAPCRNTETNFLYRAVVYLMADGTLVYALVIDQEQAWQLALRLQNHKKTMFKKKDEDAVIKRSVKGGKPWAETDFADTEPLLCTPSALHKAEARKASAKAAKAKSSPLTKDPQNASADKSGPASSPKGKKPTKPASTDAPKKRPPSKKRLNVESVAPAQVVKRPRRDVNDTRTLSAAADHPVWEFVDAAMTAMEDSKLPGDSLSA
jgi:hypothetical protein